MTTEKDPMGHPPELIRKWRSWVKQALDSGATTPFFLFAADPIMDRLAELDALDFGVTMTQWLSCKTQPLPALLQWWEHQRRPIEVVSEFELRAAVREGFHTDSILINGPAKHRWLAQFARNGQRVNFDSLHELRELLPLARRQKWRTGLRLRTRGEVDGEDGSTPTQFGFEPHEGFTALRILNGAGVPAETLHFHLRTNVSSATVYQAALDDVVQFCRSSGWSPRTLDCGGGLPPRFTRSRQGEVYGVELSSRKGLRAYSTALRKTVQQFPSIREVWLENGRRVTAGSGVLVVKVLDKKIRDGVHQLICDGGRTLNSLVSYWEQHTLVSLKATRGKNLPTIAYGPTCMAFDQLGLCELPSTLKPGDYIVWMEAGAYHLPWETRFSHGLSEVWWKENQRFTKVREAESFGEYWGRWKSK